MCTEICCLNRLLLLGAVHCLAIYKNEILHLLQVVIAGLVPYGVLCSGTIVA